MGLRLFCPDDSAQIPRRVILELTCDEDHGLFAPATAQFDGPGYVSQHAAAMKAGWMIRTLFVRGPCCSGKQIHNDDLRGELLE